MKAEYQASLEDIQKVSKVFKWVFFPSTIFLVLAFMTLERIHSLLGWASYSPLLFATKSNSQPVTYIFASMFLAYFFSVVVCRKKRVSLEARFTERVERGSKAASYSGSSIILQKDKSICFLVAVVNLFLLLFFLSRVDVFQGGWNWSANWFGLLLGLSPACVAMVAARFGDWFLASVDSEGVTFSERSGRLVWCPGGKHRRIRWSDLKYVDVQQYRGLLGEDAGKHVCLFDKEHEQGWQIMLVMTEKYTQKGAFIQALEEGLKGESSLSENIVGETALPVPVETSPAREATAIATLRGR